MLGLSSVMKFLMCSFQSSTSVSNHAVFLHDNILFNYHFVVKSSSTILHALKHLQVQHSKL